jgi:hypothetical protein
MTYDLSRFNNALSQHQTEFETMHTQRELLQGKVISSPNTSSIAINTLKQDLAIGRTAIGGTLEQIKLEVERIKSDTSLQNNDRENLLGKCHLAAMKLLDLSNKIEKDMIAVESLHRKTSSIPIQDFAGKIKGVAKLFDSPQTFDNYESLRSAVPTPKDPLFEEIMEDSKLVASAKSGQISEIEKALTTKNATPTHFTIIGESGKAESFKLWSDDQNTKHLAMDHANWKLKPLILDKITTASTPYEWMNCATKIKTCSSVLQNRDQTFCKNEGVLVYLAPKSYNAFISAGPHDVTSPSEHWKEGDVIYGAALFTVNAYLNDQKKFRLTFDLTTEIKQSLSSSLEKIKSDPDYDAAKKIIEEKFLTSFEKKYYDAAQPTNLELELDRIIRVLELIPDLESIGCTSVDVQALKRQVELYLDSAVVVQRGTQRESTTGWELDPTQGDHALAIKPRTKRQHIKNLRKKLKDKQIYINKFAVAGESVDANQASQFAKNFKEDFFKNIFRNTLQSHTLDEAIQIFHDFKTNPVFKQILEEVEVASKTQASFLRPDNPLKPSEVREIAQLCEELATEIKEASEFAKSVYNEVQLYSSECEIAGFGVKKSVLEDLKKYNSIDDLVQEGQQLKSDIDAKGKEIERLKGLSIPPKDDIVKLTTEKEALEKKEAYLGGCHDTYKILVEANKLGLPSYIHYGP